MTAQQLQGLRIAQRMPAPPDEVYDAWIDPESVREWMHVAPGPCRAVEMDVRVGGRYRFVMLGEHGEEVEITGEYVALDRPHRIAFTWKFTGTEGEPSLVTVSLEAAGDSETDLVLIHERLPEPAVEGHRAGWTVIAGKLAGRLAARPEQTSGE